MHAALSRKDIRNAVDERGTGKRKSMFSCSKKLASDKVDGQKRSLY